MRTAGECGGGGVVACNAAGAKWWSELSRTCMRRGACVGMRRVWVRGHENVRKRVLIQAAACNIGLLLRHQTGIGTPRSLQGRALSAICGLIDSLIDLWGHLTNARLGVQMDTDGVHRLNCSSPSCLNSRTWRTDFFHGLLVCRPGDA